MSNKRKYDKAFNKNGHDDGPPKKKIRTLVELNKDETKVNDTISRMMKELEKEFQKSEQIKSDKIHLEKARKKLQNYKEHLTPNEVHFFDYCKGVIDEAFNKGDEECSIFIDDETMPGGKTEGSMYFYSKNPINTVYKSLKEFYSNNHNLGLFFAGEMQGSACTLVYGTKKTKK